MRTAKLKPEIIKWQHGGEWMVGRTVNLVEQCQEDGNTIYICEVTRPVGAPALFRIPAYYLDIAPAPKPLSPAQEQSSSPAQEQPNPTTKPDTRLKGTVPPVPGRTVPPAATKPDDKTKKRIKVTCTNSKCRWKWYTASAEPVCPRCSTVISLGE